MLLRAPAEETRLLRDLLWGHDPDRVAIQGQPGDQPGIVEGGLVDTPVLDAADHDLPGNEAAGRVSDPDERIVRSAEDRVDRGDRVDAVADQEVVCGADGPVADGTAIDNLVDAERALV